MKTDESVTNTRWDTVLFLATQIIPPVLMFWFVFGQWGIGVGMAPPPFRHG